MLENGLYERYVPERAFGSINHVRCYRGVDQILKRDVLLLIWEEKEDQPSITPPSTQGMTLQLLDLGKKDKENYLVYEYVPGLPLSQAVEGKKLTIREALGLIIHIVQMMIEFVEEGRCKPLLLQENFWLTEKGELKVLNFWDDCGDQGQEITALFRLFHQLIFGKVLLKIPPRQIIEEISLSYQGNPYVIRKTLKAILHKEEKREVVLTPSFLKQIHNELTSLYQYIKNTQNKSGEKKFEIEKAEPKQKPQKQKPQKQKQPRDKQINGKKVRRWIGIGVLLVGLLLGGKLLYSTISQSLNKQPPTPFQIEVPKVKGLSLQEADKVLKEKGLSYQYYYEKSFFTLFRKSGTVIKQQPTSGEYMYRSDLIELWISE